LRLGSVEAFDRELKGAASVGDDAQAGVDPSDDCDVGVRDCLAVVGESDLRGGVLLRK
jgi:hypothetical protein